MAVVNIRWSKAAPGHLKYVLNDRAPNDVLYSHDCSPASAIDDFEMVRKQHRNEDGNHILHVVQSFNPQDSAKLTPESLNSLGRRFIEENFPDHQYVIRTHTDTENFHNHVIVNVVNSETGKKIENKRALIRQLWNSSDKLCLEHGLSVIDKESQDRAARLPHKVQQMVRHGKKPYLYDLVQKLDMARSIATTFDEYRDTLSGFGIKTLIEEKNISYFYPGRERGKRGSKLGRNYVKEGLVKSFESNRQKFDQKPELKAHFLGQYEQVKKHGMPKVPEGSSKFTQLWNKDLGTWNDPRAYTKASRREIKGTTSERELLSGFVPASEIKRASQASIFEYCKQSKIALTKNERGETVFKGREFVTVSEFEFKNGKNGTRGSLIDLVSAHKNVTLLQAVAHINGNSRLLLLEQHMGEAKHPYRSFYVPKVQGGGATKSILHSIRGTSSQALVSIHSKSAANKLSERWQGKGAPALGLLVLADPDERFVHQYVAEHRHVRTLFFVASQSRDLPREELDFFNTLKRKYQPFGISVEQVSPEKAHALRPEREVRNVSLSL